MGGPLIPSVLVCLLVTLRLEEVRGCTPGPAERRAASAPTVIVANKCFQDNKMMQGGRSPLKTVASVWNHEDCQRVCQGEKYCVFFNWNKAGGFCDLYSKSLSSLLPNRNTLAGRRSCEDDEHAGNTERDFCNFRGIERELDFADLGFNVNTSHGDFVKYVQHRHCRISVDHVTETSNKFLVGMYDSLRVGSDDNLIMSPFSLRTVLYILFEATSGTTREEIRNGLQFPKENEMVKDGFTYARSATFYKTESTLTLENGAFVSDSFKFDEDFEQVLMRSYKAETRAINTGRPEETAAVVNNWVSGKTNNRISKILNADDVTADLRLLFINVIYFNSSWEKQFDPSLTRNSTFYLNEEQTVKTEMMKITDHFKFLDVPELNAKALELPFKNYSSSMILLVPNEKDGLRNMENKMADFDLDSIKFPAATKCDVYLPKFSIESSHNMKDFLQSLGINGIFDPSRANFKGMTSEEVFVSNIIQKSFIRINEVGAEAAAATFTTIVSKSLLPQVRANRPFLYYIRDNITGMYMFAGRITNPSITAK